MRPGVAAGTQCSTTCAGADHRAPADRWTDDAVRAVADLRSSAASVGGGAPGWHSAGGGPAHPQPYIHKGNSTGRAPLHVHTALAAEHCPPQQRERSVCDAHYSKAACFCRWDFEGSPSAIEHPALWWDQT